MYYNRAIVQYLFMGGKKMNKKIVSIFVSMLLFVTVFSVTGAMNIEKTSSMTPKSASTGLAWSDDFDSYATGSALHGQGGWECWDNLPENTAYVVDDQARSTPNSCEITWFGSIWVDIVQQFTDINSGDWIITTYLYVPSDMSGNSMFILMNTYQHGGPHIIQDWSLQLEFGASTGKIWDFDNPSSELPLITDDWAELRVEIDFEADIQTVYYDGTFLLSKSWKDGVSSGGAKNLAAIDLYADDLASTSVYYDDFLLDRPQPLSCDADGPYEGLVDEEIQFDGTAAGGKPPYEYLWYFGNGDTSTVEDPVYAYSEPGVYTVNLTVTDSDQNTAWDETIATIEGLPILEIGAITGGNGITAVIKNVGNADATDVEYNIAIEGGLIITPRADSGDLGTIAPGDSETVTFGPIGIGLGILTPMPKITVTAECAEGSSAEKSAEARIILFFVLMQ